MSEHYTDPDPAGSIGAALLFGIVAACVLFGIVTGVVMWWVRR